MLGTTLAVVSIWGMIRLWEHQFADLNQIGRDLARPQLPSMIWLLFALWCFLLFGVVVAIGFACWIYLTLGTWFAEEAGASAGLVWFIVVGSILVATLEHKPSTTFFQRVVHWLAWPNGLKLWFYANILFILPFLLANFVGFVWGASAGRGARVFVVFGVNLYNLVRQRYKKD